MLKIFKGIESYKSNRAACVTTGTFDGVHIGHKKILNRLALQAQELDFESVLITFDPHPRKVLFPDQMGLQLINTLEEKLSLLEASGISSVIVHPFTTEFSRTTALIYVRDLLVNTVGMKRLVIGYDHQFGKNREGSIQQLREMAPVFDFQVDEIPAQDIDDVNVSSTKVRYALNDGFIDEANAYLGYDFFVTGTVVNGRHRGTSMGFPTANIMVSDRDKIIPKSGVYAASVQVGGERFMGALNIGLNPTFNDATEPTIEVHILDFDRDIYGKEVRVEFRKRLRDEEKFATKEELMHQIELDIKRVREL